MKKEFGLSRRAFIAKRWKNTVRLLFVLLFIHLINYALDLGSTPTHIAVAVFSLICLGFIVLQFQIFKIIVSPQDQFIQIFSTNLVGPSKVQQVAFTDLSAISLEKKLIKRGKVDYQLTIQTEKGNFELVGKWNGFSASMLQDLEGVLNKALTTSTPSHSPAE